MRYWYDFSYEEIAQVTRTTVSAVKSRLHRARGSMASLLETPEKMSRVGQSRGSVRRAGVLLNA